jgi:curved DNA-binding protein CbpA
MQAMQFMGFEELPSQTELRQRYLVMAKKLHPDRQDGRDEGFKVLSSAYERLLARVQADRL